MSTRGFIPGIWEEQINVTDFLNLNKKEWKRDFVNSEHKLQLETNYDVLVDEKRKFKYLRPFIKNGEIVYNKLRVLFMNEEAYSSYIETSDRKKFLDMRLILPAKSDVRWSFIQPDLCAIPLYGTMALVRNLKQYIKDLDKQFQTQEWTHRKINYHRSVEALHKFEEFSLKQGVNVRKPCKNSEEVANAIWLTTLFSVLENPGVSFSFYSIFTFLDVFIEQDLRKKIIDEQKAQRIIDELYCKLGGLRKLEKRTEEFDYSLTIASSRLCNTTFRLVSSALEFPDYKIPIQLFFNTKSFPEVLIEKFDILFKRNHPFAFSQSLRKRDANHLTLTSSHTFFRNYFDITMFFASFDLKKAFLVALNGGKDVETNANVQQVSTPLKKEELDLETVFVQFETFLRYYITLYIEYVNAYAYYYDLYHDLPFRQSLIFNYPYYLMNLAYHNVSPVVNLLTAIYEGEYEVKTTAKGYIENIIPKTSNTEEFIGAKLNDIIHNETNRLLFYKNGHYNVLFFAESPFFEKEDEFDIHSMSPISFLKTSFSGFQKVEEENFKAFLNNFMGTSYSHVRIHKKETF